MVIDELVAQVESIILENLNGGILESETAAYEIVKFFEESGFEVAPRPAIEVYGTEEHEAWLIEMERNEP